MIRRLFTLLSALSLVLCLAAAILWWRSYGRDEYLALQRWRTIDEQLAVSRAWEIYSRSGQLSLAQAWRNHRVAGHARTWPEKRDGFHVVHLHSVCSKSWWSIRFGLIFKSNSFETLHWREVPHWFAVVVTGIAPLMWLGRRWYAHRVAALRIRSGACVVCGYDLRAHAPGQKCPECGSDVPTDLHRKAVQ